MSAVARRVARLEPLEKALGWRFSDRSLLEEALTHASAATPARQSNERLEFLGDRVLGLLTAEALIARFPGEAEGALAPRLNALVRRESLAEIAETLDLGAYLRLARSEAQTGGRKKTALLADAMEAVIAAVYLDGGLDAARAVYEPHWGPRLDQQVDAPIDAKTALQEWAQARGLQPPSYSLVERQGPDHAPSFTVAAELENGLRATGAGAAKRAAEQAAAAALLETVKDEPNFLRLGADAKRSGGGGP